MTAEPLLHHDAEMKNRALWDEIAPIHLKAYEEARLLVEHIGKQAIDRQVDLPYAALVEETS